MRYTVNQRVIEYRAEGERMWGENKVLLDVADDLIRETTWSAEGFTVAPITRSPSALLKTARALLQECWHLAGLAIPPDAPAEHYHRFANTHEKHLGAVNFTKLIPIEKFPLGITAIEDRVAEICGIPLVAKNPFDQQSVFHFRVIRPQTGDNNPLHRDVWLEDYRDCINLYIPIAGSNSLSSLILVTGSHHWPESNVQRTTNGGIINGVKFNVPAVTAISGDFDIVRPDPSAGEALIFSPYLIHGGAVNLNHDTTRISIELRLWRR
jgi:hypothetical protein